jgi:hypothetical protein
MTSLWLLFYIGTEQEKRMSKESLVEVLRAYLASNDLVLAHAKGECKPVIGIEESLALHGIVELVMDANAVESLEVEMIDIEQWGEEKTAEHAVDARLLNQCRFAGVPA